MSMSMSQSRARAPRSGASASRWLAWAAPCLLIGALAPTVIGQDVPSVSYKEAEDHLDEVCWVEGTILRTERTAEGTYLLFSANEKYVRLLIPSANLGAFEGSLSHRYTGKRVKAIGKIAKYGYKLIVGINEPKRIRVLEGEKL